MREILYTPLPVSAFSAVLAKKNVVISGKTKMCAKIRNYYNIIYYLSK